MNVMPGLFKTSLRIITILLVLLLISCVSLENQRTMRVCKDICQQQSLKCQKLCNNDARHCQAFVMGNARKSYAKYVHQQRLQANDIALELQSFRDPLQCKKITCDCLADARMCVKFCNVHIEDRGNQ